MSDELTNQSLDNLNWRILKELCLNSRVSTAEIGRRVGLSSPAVAERIQKLEDIGFIQGYHCQTDLERIGLAIQAFITFKSKTLRKSELLKILNEIPEILEWHSITGPECVLMKVAAKSSKELDAIIARFSDYGDTTTSLILTSSPHTKRFEKIFKLSEKQMA